jgi:hypothetical protein
VDLNSIQLQLPVTSFGFLVCRSCSGWGFARDVSKVIVCNVNIVTYEPFRGAGYWKMSSTLAGSADTPVWSTLWPRNVNSVWQNLHLPHRSWVTRYCVSVYQQITNLINLEPRSLLTQRQLKRSSKCRRVTEFTWSRQRSWLRHYATSWKVAGSIPDVTGFFNWTIPYSRTMALGSTEPLTEMSTRNLSGDKGRPEHKVVNLTAICEPTVSKMREPRRLKPYGPPRPVTGIALPFTAQKLLCTQTG